MRFFKERNKFSSLQINLGRSGDRPRDSQIGEPLVYFYR